MQAYDREWNEQVHELMELYRKNPSNGNKYFTDLMAKIDDRVEAKTRELEDDLDDAKYTNDPMSA